MISPSLICLDLCELGGQVRALERAGAEMIHVDILDGHFSPSMPLGIETVRQLRARTSLAFDCHVMTTDQAFFVDELLDIGAWQIVFQVEGQRHVHGMLDRIRARGARAGVALAPATPLCALDFVLEECDAVLLMLIEPGYASVPGTSQVSWADRKVRALRAMIDERGLDTIIEVDGRVSPQNIEDWGSVADIFVAGSTCLRRGDVEGSMMALLEIGGVRS